MATLAVGSTVSVPVQGNEVFTISSAHGTSWRATFVSTATTQQQQVGGTGRTYGPLATSQALGPFNTPGVLTVENFSSSGASITYTQSGGYILPYILAQSAVPTILPSSGSSNATGQITLTTALPYQPSGTVSLYLPTGVVTAGSAGTGAGLYSVVFSSTTVCQIQGTGIVTANGAYTQTTGSDLTLATVAVPGGAMGANGALRNTWTGSTPNNANNKIFNLKLASSAFGSATITTSSISRQQPTITNRNSQALQVGTSFTAGGAVTYTTIDTSVNQNLTFTGQLAAATDYIILEAYTVEVLPGV